MGRLYLILGLSLISAVFAGAFIFQKDDFQRERGRANDGAKDALEGKAPPPLEAEMWLNSEEIDLASLKGKVVVIDFWAHWCGPCRASMPKLKELLKKHQDQGFVLIGVHVGPDEESMKKTVEALEIDWPIAYDPMKKIGTAYACDSYPDYYVIDRKGQLRFADLANSEVPRAVEALLAESP